MPIEQAQALRQSRLDQLRPLLQTLPLAGRSLTLEIGCGHGHFLTAYAAAHPDEFCLAIDLLRDRLDRAARKSSRQGLENVAWIHAEAADLLDALPEHLRIDRRVFILFPDPWPKRRHWKNRLLQAPFLTALARRCAPETQLCFRTDHAPYFEAARHELAKHTDWQSGDEAPWPFEALTVFASRAPSYHSAIAYCRPGLPRPATKSD